MRVPTNRVAWARRCSIGDVLITLHPSALLRGDPAAREQAFRTWLADLPAATQHV
jgi:hypothetical protein